LNFELLGGFCAVSGKEFLRFLVSKAQWLCSACYFATKLKDQTNSIRAVLYNENAGVARAFLPPRAPL